MSTSETTVDQGFFSLVRWRSDPTRDEARNIAVVLVQPEGGLVHLRATPPSGISPRLREQGLIDSLLLGLETQLTHEPESALGVLADLHAELTDSLLVTQPKPVAVMDIEQVLTALYRAYCSLPSSGRRKGVTKGALLDRVVSLLRARGYPVHRGEYLDEFIFDALVDEQGSRRALEVLSFAANRKDWTPIQHDAGYFLYALNRVGIEGTAVVQPPEGQENEHAVRSFEYVTGWLTDAKVPVLHPDALEANQGTLIDLASSAN